MTTPRIAPPTTTTEPQRQPLVETPSQKSLSPTIALDITEQGTAVRLSGNWNLRGLQAAPAELYRQLEFHGGGGAADVEWDLEGIQLLDSAGALVLWQAWGKQLPSRSRLRPEQASIIARWASHSIPSVADASRPGIKFGPWARRLWLNWLDHLAGFVSMLGQVVLDLAHLVKHPGDAPLREVSATIHETGGRAVPITALVGFLIGVVVSYLSSFQLETFGAQIYIVNILGLSIIRELGPLLAAILVAGRSGSAMTASIGVMRVTQELDALAAMGISHSIRLILPKVIALTTAMPLLVVWTDIIALAGGATSAYSELDISFQQFFAKLPAAVPIENFAIGLGKGAVFGLFIALIACHFGLRIQPNTESIGDQTTNSVVASITLVILADAVFAVLFRGIGLP